LHFFRKLNERRIWERVFRERLSEPLHLNILSLFVAALGTFEAKVYFDLIVRQHNAFCLLQAAKFAKQYGYQSYTAIEFGVANGTGLMNMAEIAGRVTKATGVDIKVVGFDSGKGMPPPLDYRDHPDVYRQGDFPMQDYEQLLRRLPPNTQLIIGDISETIGPFLSALQPGCPIGYVVIDVDYYSSTVECLKVFSGTADLYLPEVLMFLDDILHPEHNPSQGEYLAINEFNSKNEMRKTYHYNLLHEFRLLKNALWISQVFQMHILDHAHKQASNGHGQPQILRNPYLS
jgi:hypothetical protein